MSNQMVRWRPRASNSQLVRAANVIGPAATTGLVTSAANAVLARLNPLRVGRAAGDFVNGFRSSKGPKPKQQQLLNMGSSMRMPLQAQYSSAPVSLSTRLVTRRPRLKSGRASVRIQHREMLSGSIAGSTAFTKALSFDINPGLSASFPWLSKPASNYEMYRFHSLSYEFVPFVSTSTAGDIILCPEYDASNVVPPTEEKAVDKVDTVIDSVWKPIAIRLNPSDLHALGPRKFIRGAPTVGDIKTFDAGKIYLFTNNESGTSAVGKFFVSYDVELFTPTDGPSIPTVPTLSAYYTRAAIQTFSTGINAAALYDAAGLDSIPIPYSLGVLTPPTGVYKFTASAVVNDTSAESFTAYIAMYKNGSAVTTATPGFFKITSVANGDYPISTTGYVKCSGDDELSIEVNLTGAAGTLTTKAGYDSLILSLA